MNKFAIGAIIFSSELNYEQISVDLFEAETQEEALGKFFMQYLGKRVTIRDFSIKADGLYGFDVEVVEYVKQGKKINAIKRYQEISGADLRTAKDYIEQVVIPALKEKGVMPNEQDPPF